MTLRYLLVARSPPWHEADWTREERTSNIGRAMLDTVGGIMSVRSRVANEMGLLLSLALTAACAHGAAAPAATPTIYENARGERIVIAPGSIAIGGDACRVRPATAARHIGICRYFRSPGCRIRRSC